MAAAVRASQLCGLCNSAPAEPGRAACSDCWAAVRSERPRRPSGSYCPCGGGELHRLCVEEARRRAREDGRL
jgi:hypothetical protein